jgi:SAM-dependent methyltransferase
MCYNTPMKNIGNKTENLDTGWGQVASWYNNTINSQYSVQKETILPQLQKLLPIEKVKGKSVLDLGCGTGMFLEQYIGSASKLVGLDIDDFLVKKDKIEFVLGDATNAVKLIQAKNPENLAPKFDIILSILSIPNIRDLHKLAEEIKTLLDKNGKFIAVINHPTFRVPQSSDWYYDEKSKKQGRVVYQYKTAHTIKIDMNPGQMSHKKFTYTFHRSIDDIINTFSKVGLAITFSKEIASHKKSGKGPKQKAEDMARLEIPMFWLIEFSKI